MDDVCVHAMEFADTILTRRADPCLRELDWARALAFALLT